jgi:hypothetical protein
MHICAYGQKYKFEPKTIKLVSIAWIVFLYHIKPQPHQGYQEKPNRIENKKIFQYTYVDMAIFPNLEPRPLWLAPLVVFGY